MTHRSRSLVAGAGLVLLLAGAITACATASPAPGTTSGTGAGATTEAEVDAAWLDGGRFIGLVTQGSSTCVPIADAATVSSNGTLEVTLVEPSADTACTADMSPRVTVVGVPEGVDPSKDLEITVRGEGYEGDTDLDGLAGVTAPTGETDYLPSAGWVDDDAFVILTWGSSTCAPVVEAMEVTAPDAVTVTFATPAENQVCTMDMAPRAVLAVPGEGLDDDAPVTLTLTGGGPAFETPVTTTILG